MQTNTNQRKWTQHLLSWSHYNAIFLLLLCFVGCDSSGTIEIEPKFLTNGEPIVEASISFIRSDGEGGRASFGVTDNEGVAKLTTFEPFDGVLPGSYKVVVIKAPENPNTFDVENVDLTDPKQLALLSTGGGAPPPTFRRKRKRTLLPEVYADPGTTPLTCAIPHEGDDLVFNIDSKEN